MNKWLFGVAVLLTVPAQAVTLGDVKLLDGGEMGVYADFRDGLGVSTLAEIAKWEKIPGLSAVFGTGVRDIALWGGTKGYSKLLAGGKLDFSQALTWNLGPIKPEVALLGAFEPDALSNKFSWGAHVGIVKAKLEDVIKTVTSLFGL